MATSKIPKRFIGTIDDSNIESGANIATSKLADGANFIKRDGSIAMTGSLDLGNQTINNVATATTSQQAVNKGQMDAAIAALNSIFRSKPNARAATTGNISLAAPGATHDGVTLTSGQILYVRAQTAQEEQGLYTFNGAASLLTRIPEMDNWTEVPGAFFAVEEGTIYADSLWLCTANQGGTLNTTAMTFFQIPLTGLSASNFVTGETPAGTVDGVNQTFTLANTPLAGSEEISIEGHFLIKGAANDYTITGAVVTITPAPISGERVIANYRK